MKKNKLVILLTLFMLEMPLCAAFFNYKDNKKVNAYDDIIQIGVNDSLGIGYIASELPIEIRKQCNAYMNVNTRYTRESNIFDQPGFEGYLEYINKVVVIDEVYFPNPAFSFSNLANLTEIQNIENLNTSSAISFNQMFYGCSKLNTVDFTNFNTSSAQDMGMMFYNCGFENLDLSNFNTSGVSEFSRMFYGCKNLKTVNLSSFDIKCASDMEHMFTMCDSLESLDLSSFDFSNAPRVDQFFNDIRPSVILGPKTVPGYPFKLSFDLKQVSMDIPYYYDSELNPYSAIREANNMVYTYYAPEIKDKLVQFADSFNLTMSSIVDDDMKADVSKLRSAWKTCKEIIDTLYTEPSDKYIFEILKLTSQENKDDTVAKCVTLYDYLYNKYYSALVDKGGDFFDRCPHAGEKDGYIHIGVDTTNQIGYLASIDTYEILCCDVSWKIILKETGFSSSIFSTNGYMDYANIEKVVIQDEIDVERGTNLFKDLESVVSFDGLSNLETASATSFWSMFENCSSVEYIDLSGVETDSLETANLMFKNCENLLDINLSEFRTFYLHSISEMFYGCSRLIALDLSKLNLRDVIAADALLYKTQLLYLRTPKVMPSIESCNIYLYKPELETNYYFYDLSFNTYTKLPKDRGSFLIISELGKRVINSFCDEFLKEAEYYCKADGSTSEEVLIKFWSREAKSFKEKFVDTVHSYLLDFFKQDNSSCIFEPLKKFSSSYDYIYGKYKDILDKNGGDFASRSSHITFETYNNITLDINNKNYIILVTISLIFITCVSLLLIKKKRRHNG